MREGQTRVSEVMQREVVTLRLDDHLDVADGVMKRGRIRHLPILDHDRVIGVVSNRDLHAAALTQALRFEPIHREAFLRTLRIGDVMSEKVVTVEPDVTIREAAEVLVRHRIGCVPVVDRKGVLLGLVTETDLLSAALLDDPPDSVDVAERAETSKLAEWIEDEVGELERMRDELRVQIHLGQVELKELLEELDGRWQEVGKRVRRLARHPWSEGGEIARALIDEIRDDYHRLRERLE